MSGQWASAKAKAEEIRTRYRAQEPPISLFEIASAEGIEIIYFRPDDETQAISGLLEKDKKQIYLNVSDSAARQNFTLAHELAHYFLNHKPNEYGVYRRDSLYETSKPVKEQEADCFAAELLMPKDLIGKFKTRYALTNDDIAALSKMFGVSTSAMKYRLKDLERERYA